MKGRLVGYRWGTRLGSSVTKTLDFEADRPQTRLGSSVTKTLDFEADRPQTRLGSSMTKTLDFEADRLRTRFGSSVMKTLDFEADRPQTMLGSSVTKTLDFEAEGLERGLEHSPFCGQNQPHVVASFEKNERAPCQSWTHLGVAKMGAIALVCTPLRSMPKFTPIEAKTNPKLRPKRRSLEKWRQPQPWGGQNESHCAD